VFYSPSASQLGLGSDYNNVYNRNVGPTQHTTLFTAKGSTNKQKQNNEKSSKTKHFATLRIKSHTTRQHNLNNTRPTS